MITDTLTSVEIVALTLYGEARGEPIEGQIAVGCIIRNRGTDYKTICLANRQFSCWNANDPNYQVLIDLAIKLIHKEPILNEHFNQCLWIAEGILNRVIIDITNGNVHYLTKSLFDAHTVNWAKNAKNIKQVGSQVFFNV